MFLLWMIILALGLGANFLAPIVGDASVAYGQRPFSWYYPYSYQYYTPHRAPNSSDGCYWVYTNGAYAYICS